MLVQGFVISPDSHSVVYWTADAEGLCTGIYGVPITGGTPVDVSVTIPAYKKIGIMAVSPDSQYAVYTLHHQEYEVDSFEVLWAAPLTGGGAIAAYTFRK